MNASKKEKTKIDGRKYTTYSDMYKAPKAVSIEDWQIEKWVNDVKRMLLDEGEKLAWHSSGRAIVIGCRIGKKNDDDKEYFIWVVRDGYEEITICPTE